MRATCIVVVLTLAGNTVYADGLLYKLPKDGTWATYQIDGNEKGRSPILGEFLDTNCPRNGIMRRIMVACLRGV